MPQKKENPVKRHLVLLALGFLLVQTLSPAALAERKPYALDRSHCQLNFIGEALLISAHGSFDKWDADVQMDRDKLENSSLTLMIDATSINTRVERRDNHLRSPDFLDVKNHPQIKFVSTKVTRVDDKTVKLLGDLTIRGTTKPVEVPVKVVFLRQDDARFKGDLQINRKDFGVNYDSKMNPIEDMITVQFDFHLVDQQAMQQRQQNRPAQPPPN
jgi:polyisoprenoid-binding protein YceI